ncbi:MAG: hypothetical protein L0Z70_02745 [Chloroflexi bacterium]|nr:hypothetical protein [Chloroflexota bacterium]
MNLINRYLHEVGRYLPRKNRGDILAELRSLLLDTLDGRVQGEAKEEDYVALLKEFGPPQKVAASYSAQGQYLIGPALYPLFRMIAGIVLAAVLGAQLLAFGVAVWIGGEQIQPWETLLGLLNSIPAALGWLVVVFAILQGFDVRPELDDKPWDPRSLPEIEAAETVNRGERIFGLAAGSVILALLALFPDKIGVYNFTDGGFFANPVIQEYFGWICLSLLAGIGLDIYLLWQGRWTAVSRAARLAADLLGIAVLAILLQGHNAWLAAHSAGSFFDTIVGLGANVQVNLPLFGMSAFRMGIGVALIVTVIEAAVQVYRLLRSAVSRKTVPGALLA